MKIRTWQADVLLLIVAAIWGSTFILVKNATSDMSFYTFLGIRFVIAAASLAILRPSIKHWKIEGLWSTGFLVGLFLFMGYAFQTWGLQFTSASKAGFITGLSVILVPFLVAYFDKKRPSLPTIMGLGLATIGLGLLSLEGLSVNVGDLFVLIGALGFAAHIYSVGKYTQKFDSISFTAVQIATVGIMCLCMALLFEQGKSIVWSPDVWWGFILTTLPATSIAFLLQNSLQKYTTATHTALILAMEPVFAYFFAYLLGSEVLALKSAFGGFLIIGGVLVAEFEKKIIGLLSRR